MQNIVKQKWSSREVVTNAWLTIDSSWCAEIIANVGYDVVTIDAQHGLATDLITILPMLQAIGGSDSVPFVRLPANDPAYIMRMLDAGVLGLICPMINTKEDTENFVRATKYYPTGNRSLGATRAKTIYGENYVSKANDFTITMAMIETPEALKNIRDIASVPYLDGLYVGTWDLSMSLGYKNYADFKDESLLKIIKEIKLVADEHNLIAGIHTASPQDARLCANMGYQFVTMINDSAALKSMATNTLKEFQREKEFST